MTQALLTAINPIYFSKILRWKNINHTPVGQLFKVDQFHEYNRLIDINSVFSSRPFGDIVDRTGSVRLPFLFQINRPWTGADNSSIGLEQVMQQRTQWYIDQGQKLNLCWSGGIDSTSLVVAFLKHTSNLDQLRILYSPYSVYENRDFFNLLQTQYPQIEMIDISGDVYLSTKFDGLFVTGHGGDEFTASMDDSFYNKVGGADGLSRSWKDYFYQSTGDQDLVDFTEQYFALSGRRINTVLEARWWFYSMNKSQNHAVGNNSFLLDQPDADLSSVTAFFDCKEFENYVYHNTDCIIDLSKGYLGYKHFLKEYIYQFDQNTDFYQNYGKVNSIQFNLYIEKKIVMTDNRWICKLSDNSVVRTKNLPLLSKNEFDQAYGNQLDYLFNSPDAI